jgi:hypothetical protein
LPGKDDLGGVKRQVWKTKLVIIFKLKE